MAEFRLVKAFCSLLRNLALAALLYAVIFSIVKISGTHSINSASQFLPRPTSIEHAASATSSSEQSSATDTIPSTVKLEQINPHANWFNRPESLVDPKDNFMGPRPHVDTVANLTRLVEECRGTYEYFEKMPNVFNCMRFLAKDEDQYYFLPAGHERASQQPPLHAEYQNADGADNTRLAYPTYEPASEQSVGQCAGPIVPYHTYWTGPASWRVEVFIKSYLYTQNLPCSRLWIWLDSDGSPDAVENMLNLDSIFAKFLPLVQRGDIVLKEWKFPSRIPLPSNADNTDGRGYYATPGRPNAQGEFAIADGLVKDAAGQEWLVLTEKQKTFLPVAISDAVRFVILHVHGGVYFDMDALMIRDMRPLLIREDHSFAERWAAHSSPGDYNTAIMSLTANSSLSSYLLRGGVRMGLNFHPRVIGRMALKDGRNQEFLMLETAAFDPIWTEFNWAREGRCTIPCFHDYGQVFLGSSASFPKGDEWEAYDGPTLRVKHAVVNQLEESTQAHAHIEKGVETFDREALAKMEYRIQEDNYPPSNRTLENFFRGAWTYHVHNQWAKIPEPSSWFYVLQKAHDGFLADKRTNLYGEKWAGPRVGTYAIPWKFV